MANLPALSKKVPARLTEFGEPMKRSGGELRGALPIVPTKIPEDPLRQELARIEVNIGFPGKTIRGKELSDEEYRKYKEIAGQETETILKRVVLHPRYNKLRDSAKKALIDKAINKARKTAKSKFFRWLKESGINLSEWINENK